MRIPSTVNFPDFFNIDVDFIFAEINDEANAPFYEAFFSRFTDDDLVLDDADFLVPSNWQAVFDGTKIDKQ